MPITLNPNSAPAGLSTRSFTYRYPMNLKMDPNGEFHRNLLGRLMQMADKSYASMSNKYSTWNTIDETLTGYVSLSDAEKRLQDKDSRKPVSIVVPVSYATMEILLSYFVAAFLNDPIFKYEGVGDEDVLGAILLERLVDVQTSRARMGIQLHTMFRDSIAYGFGAMTPIWEQQMGYKTVKKEASTGWFSHMMPDNAPRKERVRSVVYEGNELYNIDPYCYFPDTSYSVSDVQRSSFCGWLTAGNRLDLIAREEYDEMMFNAKYLKYVDGRSRFSGDSSRRDKDLVKPTTPHSGEDADRMDVLYLYVKLIPSEWGLGRANYPELWVFGIAGDQVIIKAGPTELNHGMKPVVVCAPEFDGYSPVPTSKLEITSGLQTAIDFLYNSHFTNVRKSLNDMFVVDPEMININDMLTPEPGKLIRLRKRAWGQGVDAAIKQFEVRDVTASHIPDSLYVSSIIEQTTGTPDAVKGIMPASPDRRSASEYKGTRQAALSRLEKGAKLASLQAMSVLGYMLASQTQQFMTQDTYIKIVGDYEEKLRETFGDVERALVGPMDILVDFDVKVHDGTIPASGDPALWAAMIQAVGASEQLMARLDVVRMFKYWARLEGAKNVDDFERAKIQPRIENDEDVLRQKEAGNLVPIGEMV